MTSFLLADDHSIVRFGLKNLIRDNLTFGLIHEARDVTEVTRMISHHHYDLLLLDISIPDIDFTNFIHWIGAINNGPRILIFTALPENVYGLRCLQLGAHGFLHKSASNPELVNAMARILEGKKYISPSLSEQLLQGNAERVTSNPFQLLSSREMEIVLLLNTGKSLPEISSQLNIQYTTANTYKRRIFEKLHVQNLVSLSRLMQTYQMGD